MEDSMKVVSFSTERWNGHGSIPKPISKTNKQRWKEVILKSHLTDGCYVLPAGIERFLDLRIHSSV